MANSRILNNFDHDISAGKINGKSQWYKFGECEIDDILTTIWSGATALQGGLYVYPDYADLGVAILMEMVSTNALDTGKFVAIQGMDVNYKLQQEVVVLNGSTPVVTQYKYLRVWRMSAVGGVGASSIANNLLGQILLREVGNGFIFNHIVNSNMGINQSQSMFYTVPKGHTLLIENLVVTSSVNRPYKLYVAVRDPLNFGLTTQFTVQVNFNMAGDTVLVADISHPYKLTEGVDLEFRGIADARTTDVAVNAIGTLERNNSVPIDVTGLTPTPADGQVTLIWDTFTPAESQDQKFFKLDYYKTSEPNLKTSVTLETDVTGYIVDGLDNTYEYTFDMYFVGYDGLESTATTVTETPAPVAVVTPPVENIALGTITAGSIQLNWNTPIGVLPTDTYEVYFALYFDPVTPLAGILFETLPFGTLTSNITGLTGGDPYDVWVKTIRDGVPSTYTTISTATL